MPKAVKVDLVTLPAAQPRGPAPKVVQKSPPASALPKRTAPKPELKSQRSTKTTVSKKVSLTKKPLSVKKSLKEKTYKANKAVKTAIERIERELPRSRSRQVVAAIDKLKEQIAAQEVGVVKGAADKARSLELLDIYNAEIWHQIQKQWAFSSQLAQGRTKLEAIIIAKIMKDGQIRDLWFEERSGNNFFDDSVFRAMKKASPLPPLPKGYLRPYYEVGFRFNLSELQKSASQ
ncbi:MAG: TonB family protein [Deltaproteobacteria bacterium]|nr:TonB family protein [Deltaproteobacteria bacterium]